MGNTPTETRSPWSSRRIHALSHDHGLIRQWCGAVLDLCRREDWHDLHAEASRTLLDFCEDFVDRFHFRRVEKLVFAPLETQEKGHAGRIGELRDAHDRFHAHLEGMRLAAGQEDIDGPTLFSWNAIAAAGILRRGIEAGEAHFFDALERLERRGDIAEAAGDDTGDVAATYAQAESNLISLKR